MRRINHQLRMIENLRNTITVRDRSALARPANGQSAPPPAGSGDQVLMKTKSGKLFHVDSGKVDEAKQNGLVPA